MSHGEDKYVLKAFVDGLLNNGDIVTNSPKRDGMASHIMYAFVKRSTVTG